MFSALLLPLVLAAPAEPAGMPAAFGPASQGPDPAIQLWISNDRRFFPGDRAKVHVRTKDDGYLVVLHADPDGYLRVLFPLDPSDDNFVRGGKKYEVRGRGGREAFDVELTSGRGTVYAAVSVVPFRFDEFAVGGHWDYRTIAPTRLPREPETELTELVRRMAHGSYDYDILTYDIIERVYADHSYSRSYYGSAYYDDGWCGWSYYGCSSVSVGIFFGRPFRRHYYPYRYAYHPFYDPFFYDPWYYHPRYYYYPAYYYPGYYYPGYYYSRPFYHHHHHRRFAGIYDFPRYRDRGHDGFGRRGFFSDADYRDRRYTFRRAVNTVHTPPISRFTPAENSSPIRRAVERRDVETPGSVEAQREVGRRDVVAERDQRRDAGSAEPRRAEPRRGGETRRAEPTRSDAGRPEPARAEGRRGSQRSDAPIEARRARPPEQARVIADIRERRDLPVEVGRQRSSDERGRPEARPVRSDDAGRSEARPARSEDRGRSEARPSGGDEVRSAPAPRSEPRAEPRSYGGGGRAERAPSPSRSEAGGGRRSSSGGRSYSGGGGGGGRRR